MSLDRDVDFKDAQEKRFAFKFEAHDALIHSRDFSIVSYPAARLGKRANPFIPFIE